MAEYQRVLNEAQDVLKAKNNPEALQELSQAAAKKQKALLLESLETKQKALIEGAKERYKGLGNYGNSDNFGKYHILGMDGVADDISDITRQRGYPVGFNSYDEFAEFGSELGKDLNKAGYDDAISFMQGSAVTGRNSRSLKAFDDGRISDFDIAVTSPSLFEKAKSIGAEIRGDANRTGPLSIEKTPEILNKLGLYDFAIRQRELRNRPIEFMIADSAETILQRAASVVIPQ